VKNTTSAEIARIIRKERIKQDYSIRQFAESMGCTSRAISFWDKGERNITLDMADKALKVLGLSVVIGKEEGK